jgi:hypothetical protein
VTTVAVTDADGRMRFPQVTVRQYKVSATRTGAVVVPDERNVSLNRDNIGDVDFSAAGLRRGSSRHDISHSRVIVCRQRLADHSSPRQ